MAKSLDELATASDRLYELAMLNDEVAINARPSGNYIRYKKPIDRPTQEAIDEYNGALLDDKVLTVEYDVKPFV